VVFYQRNLFQTLGAKPPTTFRELLSLCTRLSAAGKTPMAINGTFDSIFSNILAVLFVSGQDPDWTLKRLQHKVTFASSPLWRHALDAFVALKNANCFAPGASGSTFAQAQADFLRGDTALLPVSVNQVAVFRQLDPSIDVAVFPFPADEAKDT